MKRRLVWISVLFLSSVLLVALCIWLWFPRLRYENYSRIQKGMTQAQVENLLGGPPGNYGFNQIEPNLAPFARSSYFPVLPSKSKTWFNDQIQLIIYFDTNGRVSHQQQQTFNRQLSTEKIVGQLSYRLGW